MLQRHVFVALTSLLLLTACNKPEPGVGERVGKKVDNAVKEAGDKLNQAQQQADGAMKDAMQKTGEALEKAGEKLQDDAKK